MLIIQDNQATVAMAGNPVHHKKPKNIDIWYHYVRNEIARKNVELIYCESRLKQVH